MSDYLAVIPIGGGSSYGRDPDKEKAIARALREVLDWDHLFQVHGIEVTVNVVDVSGYGDLYWGSYPGGWLHGTNEATGADEVIDRPLEYVKRTTAAKKSRRKRA